MDTFLLTCVPVGQPASNLPPYPRPRFLYFTNSPTGFSESQARAALSANRNNRELALQRLIQT